MKLKILFLSLMLCLTLQTVHAQNDTQAQINRCLARVEKLIDAYKWKDAFTELRTAEGLAEGNPMLQYQTAKQRLSMYKRLNKPSQIVESLNSMEQLALSTNNDSLIESMLHTKAAYYAQRGDKGVVQACYRTMLDRRSQGMDNDGREGVFKQMIEEATRQKNSTMKSVVSDIYVQWQDSIVKQRAVDELNNLKADYQAAQEDIEEKDSKISTQWGTIMLLGVLLVVVLLAVVFLLLAMLRNSRVIKRLNKELETSNQNSRQKSTFMRNIGSQISPSLSEIAKGNVQEHVKALERMMQDVETFVQIDDTREQAYETEDENVAEVCAQAAASFEGGKAPVTSDATKQQFPLNKEAVEQALHSIVNEVLVYEGVERVVLDFKKKGPRKGQFWVTAFGMDITEEERQTLFIAFAKVYNLTKTSGLSFPISSLIAQKMGGSLKLDDQFTKGARFVLEVKG